MPTKIDPHLRLIVGTAFASAKLAIREFARRFARIGHNAR
ncbi:hypothetical protein CSIRO_3261 [Bradyrhizobiaceae bacterium SG-6C]|nr:hypothetical protein CSIRO_3261 [Bradyrhizobiaceae bacterium SG-6C]